MFDADKWIRCAATRCRDCVSSHNLCAHPPKFTVRLYLTYLDKKNPQGNLLAIKSYLLTQNLFRTQLWLWRDDPFKIKTDDTKLFLETFSDVVSVKKFVSHDEIEDPPLERDNSFGSHFEVRSDGVWGSSATSSALYPSRLVDFDVVLLRDA